MVIHTTDRDFPLQRHSIPGVLITDRRHQFYERRYQDVGHPLAGWRGLLTAGHVPEFLEIVETWTVERVR
jgi:hypothetical protein